MTTPLPFQKFQLGQRVRHHGEQPFVIIYIRLIDGKVAYSAPNRPWYFTSALTLAPARLPYVPSERGVVSRSTTEGIFPELYRCETDSEMLVRQSAEWDAYEAQGDH